MKIKKLLVKSIPVWAAIIFTLQATTLVAVGEYYIMQRNLNNAVTALAKTTPNPQEAALAIKEAVLPQGGFTLHAKWGGIGKKLLESGVIDKDKYEQLFSQESSFKDSEKYLTTDSQDMMTINEQNSHFMVNTLWALGLINKSPILDKGDMQKQSNGNVMNYASTGGWTIGARPTANLYSSQNLINLTKEQQDLVQKIAENIYRPCCGNPTSFPDCNHGMAALGYIELAVSQGVSEGDIYKDVLSLNSFWFPQQYVQLAALMNKSGTEWKNVDSKLALSNQYSSAQGASTVQQQVQDIPGFQTNSGGCGA